MRTFSARETEWLLELDGVELAGFRCRAFAFLLDLLFAYVIIFAIALLVKTTLYLLHLVSGHAVIWRSFSSNIGNHEGVLPGTFFTVLYFGLLTWRGKGRSPGKRMSRESGSSPWFIDICLYGTLSSAPWAMEPHCSKAASASFNTSSTPIAAPSRIASPKPSSSPNAATRRCSTSSPTRSFPTTATNPRLGSPTKPFPLNCRHCLAQRIALWSELPSAQHS